MQQQHQRQHNAVSSPRSSLSASTAGGSTASRSLGASHFPSVSNLAEREHLDTTQPLFSLKRHTDALPDELKTRSGWSLSTDPQLAQLVTTIIEDNYNRMLEFLPQLRQLISRLSGFRIVMTTRSGVRISCRSMYIGHLLCLCASPRVLQLLQTHDILSTGLFVKKVTLFIDFAAGQESEDSQIFSQEQRQFTWHSVPSFFMVILRDSYDSFDWLMRHGYLRKLTDTDEDGRNILHASVEMESPFVLTNMLTKDSGGCLNLATLQLLFRQADKSALKLTPLIKACQAESTAMLYVMLQSLPQPFLVGELDASGRSENLICAILSYVKDPIISSELVAFLIGRGATPDTSYFDKRSCLEVLINCEHFSGHELCHLIQRLINGQARVDLGVMLNCLSCGFRTDQEILEIACELLTAAGSAVLSDAHQSEMKEYGEESLDMETNVVVKMLRNPQISPATVRILLKHFSRYVRIQTIFPSVQQLSMALVQGISGELKLQKTQQAGSMQPDFLGQKASLSPASLSLVLESLGSFAASANSDSIRRQRYKDSLFNWIMHHLFRETNLALSLLPNEKLSRLLPEYLSVMEAAQLDMNAVFDGRVSMFAAFEKTCPGWLSLSLLRKIPASFRLNIRDKRCYNIAVVLMHTFCQRYKMLLAALKTLKSKGFNMKCQVMGRYTLLMAFVEICGEGLKAMESDGTIEEDKVQQFMDVFNFFHDEGVDMSHSFMHKDVNDHDIAVNVLSLSLSLGVSILVLDIMRRHSSLLLGVSSITVLESIRKYPELLEMLNSSTVCSDHSREHGIGAVPPAVLNGLVHGDHGNYGSTHIKNHNGKPQNHGHDNSAFSGQDEPQSAASEVLTIQFHWHEYVRHHHISLLKLAIDDTESLATLVLIYDYFQTCDFVTRQPEVDAVAYVHEEGGRSGGQEETSQKKTPKKKKPKLLIQAVRVEQGIFRNPWGPPDRMHSKLMKAMAGNATLKGHPMVSEYLERFYISSFVMAVLMNLFHLAYLILYVGHIAWVTTNPKSEANHYTGFHLLRPNESYRVTGYYVCSYANCPGGPDFLVRHSSKCVDLNETCTSCTGRLLDSANCLPGTDPVFSRCPIYDWDRGWFWVTPAQYILIAISAVCIIKEIYQLITNHRTYLKKWMQNIVEVAMYCLILITSINVTECPWSSGLRETWQYSASILASFLTWSMMFFYLSRFQVFSTYVMMFYASVKTGLGVLIAFLSVILGFVQVFHMLLNNQFNFRDYWVSSLKVFDMMVGELDYNEIFSSMYSKDEGKISTADQKLVYDDVFTRVVFFFFILTMPIVLMNLFIGLIVGDVQQINDDAEVKTWTNCVGFIDMTYSMLRWRNALQRCCKRMRRKKQPQQQQQQQQQVVTSPQEQSQASNKASMTFTSINCHDEESLDVRHIRLDSIGKHTITATLLGLISGRELSRRLMASEKRKLQVKVLARNLHNRLPFLYNVYDPNTPRTGLDEFDIGDVSNNSEGHHHHENRHICGASEDQYDMRRLAVPEDVQADDPFLRLKRDTLIFPNRLNRLRSMPAVAESEDSETTGI